MALLPSHLASVPVLDAHPIRSTSRELYLLRQRAETFRVELELESQLQLLGVATLPIEWSVYLEHQRQLILDKIQWMESRDGDFTSSLGTAHDAYPTHTPPSIRGHNESTPVRPEESVHTEGNERSPSHWHASSTTFGADGSPSQETHTYPDASSSTVHGHTTSPDEHIRQSPEIALGSPSIDHENVRRDNSLRTVSTRRDVDPRPVEPAHYQPHAGMFNGSQSATISGGVFMYVQGNVSYMAEEILALQ